jgi:TonB family protein
MRTVTIFLIFSIALAAVPQRVGAGDDVPWSCKDADSVYHAARKFSQDSGFQNWDTKKLEQSSREYLQCFRKAADDGDRLYAGWSLARNVQTEGYVSERWAEYANAAGNRVTLAHRQRFFAESQSRALFSYRKAKSIAAYTLTAGQGQQDADLKQLVAKINVAIARTSAMTFASLKSYEELMRTRKGAPTQASTPIQRKNCAPNSGATVDSIQEPDMPPEASAQSISGTVHVQVNVNVHGDIDAAKVLDSPSEVLNEEALRVARAAKMHPAIKSCLAVPSVGTVSIGFAAQ